MRAALLLIASSAILFASEHGPGHYIDTAPSGRFTITQRWVRPDYIAKDADCTNADCGWESVLRFADQSKPEATLAAQPEWYSWPADYHLCPDEQWILRDQKTGSGQNALFLYHVEPDGRVWRLAQHIDDLVFGAIVGPLHLTRSDYSHLEVVLVSWDLQASTIHLKASATPENHDTKKIISGRAVTYDFIHHAVHLE